MITERERLLARLADVEARWAAKRGDPDGTEDAEAEDAYWGAAQPILDALAELRRGGSPRR